MNRGGPHDSPRTKLQELIQCQENYDTVIDKRVTNINKIIKELENSIAQKSQRKSRPCRPSETDNAKSGTSQSDLTLRQASLEASKIRLKFLEEESNIEKQISELENLLKRKKAQCELEMCEHEISVIMNSSEELTLNLPSVIRPSNFEDETVKFIDSTHISSEPKVKVTDPLVQDLSQVPSQVNRVDLQSSQIGNSDFVTNQHRYHESKAGQLSYCDFPPTSQASRYDFSDSKPSRTRYHEPVSRSMSIDPKLSSLRFNAPQFVPQKDSDSQSHCFMQSERLSHGDHGDNMQNQFSQFLIKKDLILSRLSKYDDNPVHFMSWKLSFRGVMSELSATPNEELDLLIKYLGPESSKQVSVLRACNAGNPEVTIKKIWERMEQRYGSPEKVENHLRRRITSFQSISAYENSRLYDFADLVAEISAVKTQAQYKAVFAQFDSSTGVNLLVSKLPRNIQDKWTSEATRYKRQHKTAYPPFEFFDNFIENMAEMRNDPSFYYANNESKPSQKDRHRSANSNTIISTRKTQIGDVSHTKSETTPDTDKCPIHNTNHSLNECVTFRKKPIHERKRFVLKSGICFRCCGKVKHRAKKCRETIKCTICRSDTHPSALHVSLEKHEGEKTPEEVEVVCTQVCGKPEGTSKSCAKIVPVQVYKDDNQDIVRTVYAMIDDQSSHSLATSSLFDAFNDFGPDIEYSLTSCAGKISASGRKGSGYVVRSLDGSCTFRLPPIIECNDIPQNRDEISTPDIALRFEHLKPIASLIPKSIDDAEIEILIGRDISIAHFVLDQKTGTENLPFAQKLPLGWVVIGQVCLGTAHAVNVNKTFVLHNGRPSLLEPCSSEIYVNEHESVFQKTKDDEKLALSVEDKMFINLMNSGFERDKGGFWTAPLPFKKDRPRLPYNKSQAVRRAKSFDQSLLKNRLKYDHVKLFMDKIFDKGHAEIAPNIADDKERWYLPMFGVYHPKKPNSIRVVFDSSSRYNGISLNDALMKGPDLVNSLQGILLRFRRERVAITADVEQMFHNFRVKEDHRDFLRFLWHPDSDLDKPLKEFRMAVHVFGNSPSPAVATYGLRKAVESARPEVRSFVSNEFYVDDGLVSCPNVQEVVDLVKETQSELLVGGQLRLHKIASNSKDVLKHFDANDLAKDLSNVNLSHDSLPMQRSLGVQWDINRDTFTFTVSSDPKPYTRRGILSCINSLFDPIGFTAPVTLEGKLLLRDLMSSSQCTDWDSPLDESLRDKWENWVKSLKDLETVHVPRMYCTLSVRESDCVEVHIFCDASKGAIAAVAYIKVVSGNKSDVGFLMGKAKVSPVHGHTIPRLELCSALLATEMAETLNTQLEIDNSCFKFYSDSQIVLGYISNDIKRFHVYVANRVSRIRSFSNPQQWNYIPTEDNPADFATRGLSAIDLPTSTWLLAPLFLAKNDIAMCETIDFPLVVPELDKEVRVVVQSAKVNISQSGPLKPYLKISQYFDQVSEWKRLVRTFHAMKNMLRSKYSPDSKPLDRDETERFIIRQVQLDEFPKEISAIQNDKKPPRNSPLLALNPILDGHGVLRVGGRLKHLKDSNRLLDAHPIILPKGHHVSLLLIKHYHASCNHQGRSTTEGMVRSAGFWIVDVKRTINSLVRKCVLCRKLRGKLGWTQMANLPADRLTADPPFSYVGVDVFGPWPVVVRRTRGVTASNKRWGLLLTCLVSRAVHVELIEELTSASFINALRRFIVIRGPVRQFRSDRGTNFVGGVKELNINSSFVERGPVATYLTNNNITWIFNPPHASHFGGIWERMIGSCRRILDALLLQNKYKEMTHEVLATFISEVCAIINSRPLVPISNDPENPSVLWPSLVLTQKPTQFSGMCEESNFGTKDAIRSQWKLVQKLASEFWDRWHSEYIHGLQNRSKWKTDGVKFSSGDVVLLRKKEIRRCDLPMAVIERNFHSDDGKIRKVELSVVEDGLRKQFVRPISEIIQLVEVDD